MKSKLKYLLLTTFSTFILSQAAAKPIASGNDLVADSLLKLEQSFSGKIGVYAIDTANYGVIQYRANERFPVQSTMKMMGVAALLKLSESNELLLQEKIHYTKDDLVAWHPITGKYLAQGMTLEALAEAAISYSDNPAMNIIMKKLGGPQAITKFANSIGNKSFNVEHYEGNLNSNPNESQDTSTPKDMALSVQNLAVVGGALAQAQQVKLVTWMINNTVGNKRIRAGVPIGFTVADKTGSGDYGIANDIGIVYSPRCKPIILAIYTNQSTPNAKRREDIVASTASVVLAEFARHNNCFKSPFH